jgi:hypothetical protein
LLLPPYDRDAVSGDLLEEYRESIYPVRGRVRADVWFVTQVLGFLWRDNRLWAALLGGALVTRTALDWLVPTVNVQSRSTITTVLVVGLLLCAGFSAAWRSRSAWTGVLAGIMSVLIAAIISMVGAIWILAFYHDQHAFAAIQASGGLGEVFTLPMTLVGPGALLGAVGGAFGHAVRQHVGPPASTPAS